MKARGVMAICVVVALALSATAATVNVKDLGASGNGNADDWTYLQQALSQAGSSDTLTVVVPAGTYRVSKPLSIFSNTTLQLAANATMVMNDSSMLGVLRAQHRDATGGNCPMDATCKHGGYTQIRNVKITGGTWYHKGANGGDEYVIQLQHGDNITLENLSCKGNVRHHLNCSGSQNVTVRNVKFLPSEAHPYVIPTDEAAIGDMRLREAIHVDFISPGTEAAYPLDDTPCKDITVVGCTFDHVIAGVGTHRHYNADGSSDPVAQLAERITVTNCTFNAILSYAASMYGFSESSFVGNQVICDPRLPYAPAIRVNGDGSVRVAGNRMSDASWHGIYVEALDNEQLFVSADDNVIVSSGANSSSDGACGISLSGSGLVAYLNGNTISNTLSHGVYVRDGAAAEAKGCSLADMGDCALVTHGSGSRLTFSGGSVARTKVDGVRAQYNAGVAVYDSVFENIGQHGVLVQGEASATVSGCTFDSPSKAGVYLLNPGLSVIEYNVFANAGGSTYASICAEKVPVAPTIALQIVGNRITASKSHGIYVKDSGGVDIRGNTIDGTTLGGIYYNSSDSGTIVSNEVSEAGTFGILVAGDSVAGVPVYATASVIGNQVSTAASSNGADISIGANTAGCTVSGNVCGHNGFAMASQAGAVDYHPADATIAAVTLTSTDTARIGWTGLVGVSGYFVEYSAATDFANCQRCADVSSETSYYDISGLSASATWYVRVRAYHVYYGTRYESLGDSASVRRVNMSGSPEGVFYTVRFDANGGIGTMADQAGFVYGTAKALNRNQFTNPGYLFSGWSRNQTATSASYADGASLSRPNPAPGIGETITLYAVWKPDASTYTVRFDGNGATSGQMADQPGFEPGKGGRTLNRNQYERAGYDFLGWSKYNLATTPVWTDGDELVTSTAGGDTLTLYAVWSLQSGAAYTVRFNANGGSGTMADQTDFIPGVAGKLSKCKFTNTGYVFQGWALSATATAAAYADESMFTSSTASGKTVTLYAVWKLDAANTYTVHFDGNGATSGQMADQPGFVPGKGGRTLNLNRYVRAGYDFLGWSKVSTATNPVWTDGASLVTSTAAGGSLTLYAVWSLQSGAAYTVRFNANGGSGTMADQTDFIPGVAGKLSKCKFTNTGYVFQGWALSATATAAAYADESMFTSSTASGKTVTLYAVWKLDAANTYTVHFDGNGATSGQMADQPGFVPGKGGRKLNPNKFANVGYEFLGWSKYPAATEPVWTDGATLVTSTQAGARLVVYAVWKLDESITYSVEFDANGGKGTMPVQPAFVYGKGRALAPNAFTREGYVFKGWNRSMYATSATYADCAMVYRPDPQVPVGGTMRLFAVWEPDPQSCTVSFDANGGEGKMADQPGFLPGELKPLAPNAFVRPGYVFVGWSPTPERGNSLIPDGSDFATGESMTLYAIWEENPECYTVQFDPNGGFGQMADQMGFVPGKGGVNLAYNRFVRPGYRFLGWSRYNLAKEAVWEDGVMLVIKAANVPAEMEVTLYAVWAEAPDTYVIEYDANGGEGAMPMQQGLPYGEGVTLSQNAFVKDGFDFVGWTEDPDVGSVTYAEGEEVECQRPVGGGDLHICLYAVWQERKGYQILLDRNDKSSADTRSIWLMPDELGQLPRLASVDGLNWARRGYEFKGWSGAAGSRTVLFEDWECVQGLADEGETINLYAVWSLVPDFYAIRFVRNDGAGTWRTVGFQYDNKTRMPSLAYGLGWARRGYAFKGWALTTADANAGETWKADCSYIAKPTLKGKTLDIYAVWELKPGYYQIRFNKNDGTTKWRSLGFQRDVSTKLSTIKGLGWERDGFQFVGWASSKTNADAGKVWKLDGASVKNVAAEGKTLGIYAIWKAMDE